jgi:hypothetical protein
MMGMKRAALALLYSLLALLVGELSSRAFLGLPVVRDEGRFHDDLSWRRSWVRRHHRGAQIRFGFDRYDPTTGWRPQHGLRDVRVFGGKTLNTNSRGFRGMAEYALGKQANKTRILVLGDSFTFGEDVSDTETYPHDLQELMPSAEVINMGVHGYGHDQMLLLLKEEGPRYEPSIVMLGFVEHDIERNATGVRDYAKPRFVVDGGALVLVGSPVPRPDEIVQWDWARPRLYDIWSIGAHEAQKWTGAREAEERVLTGRILEEIVRVVVGLHATPLIVYLPVGAEITSHADRTEGERFLFHFCESDPAARCLSVRPYFTDEAARGTELKAAGHWEPAEHLVAARAIRDYLTTEAGLCCAGPDG